MSEASPQERVPRRCHPTPGPVADKHSLQAYALLEPPLIQTPPAAPLPDPADDPDWYGQIWLQYPLDPKLYSAHFPQQFRAQAKIRTIMNDGWLRLLRRGPSHSGVGPGLHQAYEFSARLRRWYDNLPAPLSPGQITLPSQLMLQ